MTQDINFVVGDNAKQQLVSFVERMERLAEEKAALGEDMKEVMSEAKTTGFDTKTIRKVLSLRKMDPKARNDAQALVDTYMAALGDE